MKKAFILVAVGIIFVFLGGAIFESEKDGYIFGSFLTILVGMFIFVGALFSAKEDGNGKLLQDDNLENCHIYEVAFCGHLIGGFVVLLRDQRGEIKWYEFKKEPPKIFKVVKTDGMVDCISYPP